MCFWCVVFLFIAFWRLFCVLVYFVCVGLGIWLLLYVWFGMGCGYTVIWLLLLFVYLLRLFSCLLWWFVVGCVVGFVRDYLIVLLYLVQVSLGISGALYCLLGGLFVCCLLVCCFSCLLFVDCFIVGCLIGRLLRVVNLFVVFILLACWLVFGLFVC